MEKKLLEYYEKLPPEAKGQLVMFAEFLIQRYSANSTEASFEKSTAPVPLDIPRPEEETVVKAVKRLSKSYFMLDKSKMLHETSQYMAAHLMEGEAADKVIDDIEAMFKKYYEKFLQDIDK